jgi:hypothetical protein
MLSRLAGERQSLVGVARAADCSPQAPGRRGGRPSRSMIREAIARGRGPLSRGLGAWGLGAVDVVQLEFESASCSA